MSDPMLRSQRIDQLLSDSSLRQIMLPVKGSRVRSTITCSDHFNRITTLLRLISLHPIELSIS